MKHVKVKYGFLAVLGTLMLIEFMLPICSLNKTGLCFSTFYVNIRIKLLRRTLELN